MKLRVFKFVFFCVLLALIPGFAHAANAKKIPIYFFWGIGCGECEHQKVFLQDLKKKYPQIEIRSYESLNNSDNAIIFSGIARRFNISSPVVPATFIDNKSWIGYNASFAREIENRIEYCLKNKCVDPLVESPSVIFQGNTQHTKETKRITLPFFGEIEPSNISLPVVTLLLASFDAFNPCVFFVLLILLSLLVRSGSRKRIFFVGAIFVFFSGFIYFLFMAAWLNLFIFMGRLHLITSAAGAIAVIIAAINIKDFFFFKKGPSLLISEQAKPKLFERMRNLISKGSLPSLIFATIALGVMANTYELFCTAGFPLIYTRVLTLANLPLIQYYLYLILYNIIYVLPLLVIVLILGLTLNQKKLTEWQGQVLKLVSGLMMLFLGLILIIKPVLLENIFIAASVLILAILTSIATILISQFFSHNHDGA